MGNKLFNQSNKELNKVFNQLNNHKSFDINLFQLQTILCKIKNISCNHSLKFHFSTQHIIFKSKEKNIEIIIDFSFLCSVNKPSASQWLFKYLNRIEDVLSQHIEVRAVFISQNDSYNRFLFPKQFDYISWRYLNK